VPESSFGGVQIAIRVQKTVPGRQTSNGKSPAAVRAESVVRAVDFAQRNGDVCGRTVGHSERRGTEVGTDLFLNCANCCWWV